MQRVFVAVSVLGLLLAACGTELESPASSPSTPASAAASASSASAAASPSASASVQPPPAQAPSVALELVADGLAEPIGVTNDGARDGTLYINERNGRIVAVEPDGATRVFLDISDRVRGGGEQGLLGLAFHPDYSVSGGAFYVDYTDRDGNTVVSQFSADGAGGSGMPDSERVLLQVEQPAANHNGGQLAFGPDGYLYIALGDGGGGGDQFGNGQRPDTLLGTILRIDVNDEPAAGKAYAIPPDNPFVAGGGAPEVWAYGLRNPWRFSFDAETGDLWVGDVGQGSWEEIDRVPAAGGAGVNLGWPVFEGNHCFGRDTCEPPPSYRPPLTEYATDLGCAVTGGYVYRGSAQPRLAGLYLFGDYCNGNILALAADAQPPGGGAAEPTLVLDSEAAISSFGTDLAGELYLTDLAGGALCRIVMDN